MRNVPTKPKDIPDMYEKLKDCVSPTLRTRRIRAHRPLPGKELPEPCDCCNFGHGTEDETRQQMADEAAEETRLDADKSKNGKARFSRWRMQHAQTHGNVQPGKYGEPFFEIELDEFVLDLLHLAELNVPKIIWKHAILNNCSDEDAHDLS